LIEYKNTENCSMKTRKFRYTRDPARRKVHFTLDYRESAGIMRMNKLGHLT
jgi:hypothetical protein